MTQIRVVERPDADEVDGFCVACKAEVIVSAADRRCPDCGEEVHPDSLPSQERLQALRERQDASVQPAVALARVQAAERPPEKTAAPVIVLPASRAAAAWRKATEDLLAAADREQQEAQAAYEASKSRLKAANTQLATVRHLQAQVRVQDGAATDVTMKPARKVAGSRTGGRWARDYDACRICGDTERPHKGQGRCARCERHHRAYHCEYPEKGSTS
ncbi:MAG: hypothetical protein AB7P40_00130 [Chloroflexota bacterium]